jgi:hypothetical protein
MRPKPLMATFIKTSKVIIVLYVKHIKNKNSGQPFAMEAHALRAGTHQWV